MSIDADDPVDDEVRKEGEGGRRGREGGEGGRAEGQGESIRERRIEVVIE